MFGFFETGIPYVAWGGLEQLIPPTSIHKCWDYSSVPPCLLFSRKFHHLPPLGIGICKCISSFGILLPIFDLANDLLKILDILDILDAI